MRRQLLKIEPNCLTESVMEQQQWNLLGSIYFCITVYTTIVRNNNGVLKWKILQNIKFEFYKKNFKLIYWILEFILIFSNKFQGYGNQAPTTAAGRVCIHHYLCVYWVIFFKLWNYKSEKMTKFTENFLIEN